MWLSLLFGFFPFVAVVLVILTCLFNKVDEQYRNTLRNDSRNVVTTLNLTISNMENTSVFLIADPAVRNFMLCEESSPEYTTAYQQVIDTLRRLPYKVKSYQYVVLLSDGKCYAATGIRNTDAGMRMTQEECRKADEMAGQSFWSITETQLSICRKMRDMYDVRRGLGYIKVGIAKRDFDKILSMGENSYYLLMDSDKLLIDNLGCSGPEFLQQNGLDYESLVRQINGILPAMLDGKKVLATPMLLEDGELLFLHIAEDNRRHIQMMAILIALILVLGMGLSLLQLYFSKKWITAPITQLGELMGAIESEDFSVRSPVNGRDEISLLASQFNLMSEKLEFLYHEVYQNELHLKDAELRTLQAEMHPHFLFNILNTVYWTIKVKDYENAADMVMDLSQMFQYSLSKSDGGLVLLEKELQHMRSYLRLQKSRLQEKLIYSIDVQDEIESLPVMKLILQPLVENAISHGSVSRSDRGVMSVSVFTGEAALYYTVYDDGMDADFCRIRSALDAKEDPRIHSGHGIALYNMNRRLKLKFGEGYGITCSSPEDGGTMFVVKQPIMKRKEMEET